MTYAKSLLTALFFFSLSFAQVSLTGLIVDPAGNKIENAEVTLVRKNLTTNTNNKGIFDFQDVHVIHSSLIYNSPIAQLRNRYLEFTLKASMLISLRIFDLKGRLISQPLNQLMEEGRHTFNLNSIGSSSQLYIIQLIAGAKSLYFKTAHLNLFAMNSINKSPRLEKRSLAKAGIWTDSLLITHSDYKIQQVPVADYQTAVTITLYPQDNRAPEITGLNNATVYAYEKLAFIVSAEDPDGGNVTISSDNLPANADLTDGLFTWQTMRDDTGTHEITFTADDGIESSSKAISVNVIYADVDTCVRIEVLRPNGGEIYRLGDTMTITWAIDKERGVDKGVRLLLSINAGTNDAMSFNDNGFRDDSVGIYVGNIGTYNWVVDSTLPSSGPMPLNMITEECVVQIWGDYQPNVCNGRLYTYDVSDGLFSIRE